jgi:hypothetical protein
LDIFIAFVLSWISTVSGVALGGYLVFKTKRENYEGLFNSKEPQGQAFNIDEMGGMIPAQSTAEIPRPVFDANSAFIDQFAATLASKDRK